MKAIHTDLHKPKHQASEFLTAL